MVQMGRTGDKFPSDCLRNIWLIIPLHDIKLKIEYVSGSNSKVADALSKMYWDKSFPLYIIYNVNTNYQRC